MRRLLFIVILVLIQFSASAQTKSNAEIAMETFYVFLTLSSLTGPQVMFISPPHRWRDNLACSRELPKIEDAVSRLIRYDESALELFGTIVGGPIKPGYFVSASRCMSGEPSP